MAKNVVDGFILKTLQIIINFLSGGTNTTKFSKSWYKQWSPTKNLSFRILFSLNFWATHSFNIILMILKYNLESRIHPNR